MWYTLTLAVGIILLIISLSILRKSLAFLRSSERAVGTVIELERIRDSDGDTFKPIFKYKTISNQEFIYRPISSSNPPGWKIGEEATIAYDPNNPSVARLLTYFGTFSWTIILMAIAMPFIVVGGGYHLSQALLK
ncbi:MAG: DUF3592 domain-containing protein [Chitinophagaceae bacterium]